MGAGMVCRILIVDDDSDMRAMLELALCDHQVRAASTGADALDLLDQGPYDLVVLDLTMPGMDGDAVKREMDRRGHQIPVLLLSGEPSLPERAAEVGVRDFLAKPLDLCELDQRVNRLLTAPRGAPVLSRSDVRGWRH